jgi:hypothetical protein
LSGAAAQPPHRLPKYTAVTTPALSNLPAQAVPLHCHPATPCGLALQASVSLAQAGAVVGQEASAGLLLCWRLSGDVAALRLPAPTTPGPADGLWQHTCFEAFVALSDETAYREFNFSPSGQWAAYRFCAERVRDTQAEAMQPRFEPLIDLTTCANTLTLHTWIPDSALPQPAATQRLQLGLSAVLEDHQGQLSYWALQHPSARPDFHHRGGLSLTLAWPLLGHPPTVSSQNP